MSRPKKKFAEMLEDHMAVASLQECRDIFNHTRLLLHIREKQALAEAEAAKAAGSKSGDTL